MNESTDVLVIGAGIHGAGVAQAAAAAGHDVLVLEARGVAAGTSSRSSKLIHGGLRYLETGQISVVRECLHERRRLLALAPELVHLRTFLLPVYASMRRHSWQIRGGLALYAMLAGFDAAARFGTVPREQWGGLDGLETNGLRRVFRFHDAQTDDAALTAAVLDSARGLGARLACPARLVEATATAGGVRARAETDAGPCTIDARVVVNAAGPWAPRVLDAFDPAPPRRAVELVQGAHVVLPGRLERGLYYVEAPGDGRAVFVMPWRDAILVGTTETPFEGDPATVAPRESEIAYLCDVAAHHFPALGAEPGRVVEAFAGLRVLPADETAPFRRSRETIVDLDDSRRPRVATIYGGKLTAYRVTAARVLAALRPALPARPRRADTAVLPLGRAA